MSGYSTKPKLQLAFKNNSDALAFVKHLSDIGYAHASGSDFVDAIFASPDGMDFTAGPAYVTCEMK